jgi:hypothetical protein
MYFLYKIYNKWDTIYEKVIVTDKLTIVYMRVIKINTQT